MGAIIKAVSFKNFYNYYGDYAGNTYHFTEGLNFINADNNGGKTKFFNGFLWLFTDKVYDQNTKSRVPVSESYEKMLSLRAKREANGRVVTMGVKVTFVDDRDSYYELEKSVEFRPNKMIVPKFIGKKTTNGDTRIAESDTERGQMLDILIPPALYNYSLLQGEYMDSMLDLTSKKGLTNTINSLSGISLIKTLVGYSNSWAKNAVKELNSKQEEANQNNAQGKKLLETQKRLIDVLDDTQSKIAEYSQQRSDAIVERDKLEALISTAKEREEWRHKYVTIEKEISEAKEKREKFEEGVVKEIFGNTNPWLFLGLGNEMQEFRVMRDNHFMEIHAGASQVLLPIDSPDRPSLKRMLDNCICEVCGRPFDDHSQEWNHVNELYQRGQETSSTTNNILMLVDNVRSSIESRGIDDVEIRERIKTCKKELSDLLTYIQNKTHERDEIIAKFQNVGGKIDDDRGHNTDSAMMKDYGKALKDINDCDNKLKELNNTLTTTQRQLNSINSQIEDLPSAADIRPYKEYVIKTNAIFEIIRETKDNIFHGILSSLEKASNVNYSLLTKDNPAGGGLLKFVTGDNENIQVVVKSINDEEQMLGLGTGFQRMQQMAILMAIMQTQIGGNMYSAPFIADAPFSEFASNFIHNFINETPKVFKQEIILTKDTVETDRSTQEVKLNSLGEELKEQIVNKEINGTFYLNQPNQAPDQTTLSTVIRQFN